MKDVEICRQEETVDFRTIFKGLGSSILATTIQNAHNEMVVVQAQQVTQNM